MIGLTAQYKPLIFFHWNQYCLNWNSARPTSLSLSRRPSHCVVVNYIFFSLWSILNTFGETGKRRMMSQTTHAQAVWINIILKDLKPTTCFILGLCLLLKVSIHISEFWINIPVQIKIAIKQFAKLCAVSYTNSYTNFCQQTILYIYILIMALYFVDYTLTNNKIFLISHSSKCSNADPSIHTSQCKEG